MDNKDKADHKKMWLALSFTHLERITFLMPFPQTAPYICCST